MLIVLEGCDGTGKTTLAKLLSAVLNAEIIHCSTRTKNDLNFFCDIIDAAKTKNIIADRFCYGQFVYQAENERPLNGVGLGYTAEDALNTLELKLLKSGAKIILVDAPTEVIEKRLATRNETLINGLTIDMVREEFRKLKNNSLLTWAEYSTGGEM